MSLQTRPAEQGFARNRWYVAAFSHEVGREFLARTYLDIPVVLFRTENGDAVALLDRCPHRNLPLSMGRLVGNVVRCGYHGIEFNTDGTCAGIPQQTLVPPRMCVRAFPVVEKWQWLWIWMGDEVADPALIPDHSELGLQRKGFTAVPFFMMEFAANYQYLFDNLLDSTHVSYIHEGLLDSGEVASSVYSVRHSGNTVIMDRKNINVCFDAGVAKFFHVRPNYLYDRELNQEARLPNIVTGKNIITDPKNPGQSFEFYGSQGLTPSTARSTYFFNVAGTSYEHDWTPQEIHHIWNVVHQDKVALDAIQARHDQFGPDYLECSIKSDHAGMEARRILTDMVAADVASARAAKPQHARPVSN